MGRRVYPVKQSRSLAGRQPLIWIVVLLVVVLLRCWSEFDQRGGDAVPPPLKPGVHSVERAVDGDTILLTTGQYVRLIGADTPETVRPNHPVERWGPEASEFTRQFVCGGKVRLEFDGPTTDKYGRTLAHVWVDGRLLEEELIRAGLARATTHYRFSQAMKDRFIAAETEAKAANRGLWSR